MELEDEDDDDDDESQRCGCIARLLTSCWSSWSQVEYNSVLYYAHRLSDDCFKAGRGTWPVCVHWPLPLHNEGTQRYCRLTSCHLWEKPCQYGLYDWRRKKNPSPILNYNKQTAPGNGRLGGRRCTLQRRVQPLTDRVNIIRLITFSIMAVTCITTS